MNQREVDVEVNEECVACERTIAMDIVSEDGEKDPHSAEEHPEQDKEKGRSPVVDNLMKDLEQYPDAEAKLQHIMQFMESSLAQGGSPQFRSFWEARDICVTLFKENIAPAVRSTLWTKYRELTKEARRLKSLLDEQSAFAVEQIEMAVQALESDITKLEEQRDQETSYQLPITCKALEAKYPYYCKMQRELDLLNTQASRINGLRKEIIKTEMRVRKKNQFFQRLSLAGDRVFPRRKELIKEVSQSFTEDIDSFIKKNFSQERVRESLFFLREEIKSLQGIAKLLTLNANAFTHSRVRLSECWDKLKLLDKERKQYRQEQKAGFQQHADAVLQKIEEYNQEQQQVALSTNESAKKLDEIVAFMRSRELGREEVAFLREHIDKARKVLLEKSKIEEENKQSAERERIRQKQQKMFDLSEEVQQLLQAAPGYDMSQLVSERDNMLEKILNAPLQKVEKQELERQLKSLRDLITEKKEQALLTLSADDRQSLQQLKELLQQRKERRQGIKEQLEVLRKASGNSGLDFEKAMEYNSQLNDEKERLEKLNQSIKEVERSISELEKRVR